MSVNCELSENGKRICVWFPYSPAAVDGVKSIPGAKFVPREKGGPFWTIPLDIIAARTLRSVFPELTLGPRVITWGTEQVKKHRDVMEIAGADTATLERLPKENKKLHKLVKKRPYQLADIAHMSATNALNTNEPSLGKTVETIGAAWEAGLEDGANMVVAPVTALDSVWEIELAKYDGAEIIIYQGPSRYIELIKAREFIEDGTPFWFLTNPDTVRNDIDEIEDIVWSSITIDEFHTSGLSNTKTKFFAAANRLQSDRKWLLSGTPFGGKPIKLWAALHFLFPDSFTSKWAWVDTWLEKDTSGYAGHPKIGGIKHGMEEAFYQAHRPYLIRRTKAEVRPELPDQIPILVPCEMTSTQADQYRIMAQEAEIRIDEEMLSATNVLALYTRLKQFANSRCDLLDGRVVPTFDSGKLPMLLARLNERGIGAGDDGEAGVLIGTQFKPWGYLIENYLSENGIEDVGVISGDTSRPDRKRLAGPTGLFETGKIRVLILQTKAGGTALNLDRAESVHQMDETWNPDDQSQLADRGHRFTGLTVYTYQSKESIEQYIAAGNFDKSRINNEILDLRRRGLVHA